MHLWRVGFCAWCALVLTLGCGGGKATPDGALSDGALSDGARPDGAPADAQLPDGPPATSPLVASDGSSEITAWAFPSTPTGASAGVTLYVTNAGTATTGALALSITGADAADFTIVAAGSTCDGQTLGAGDDCYLALEFTPTAAGTVDAALHVDGASIPLDLPLSGSSAGPPPAGLTADASVLDFGPTEINKTSTGTILLSNTGSSTITLGARSVTAGFSITGTNCPATLTAGGACTVNLSFKPTTVGAVAGTFTQASSAGDVTVDLAGIGLRRVTVAVSGAGTGTVTSVPSGIDCGTTCTGLFVGPVTLTATAGAGSQFAGWTAACGSAATCTLSVSEPGYVGARFVTDTALTITITYGGTAPGFVYAVDGSTLDTLATCRGSCTTLVDSGTQVTLYGFTPSTFSGWTGDCTSSTSDCNLGTVVADRAATVTFDPDEREAATLLLDRPVTGLAMIDGDLVIADAGGVSRRQLDGTLVWRTPIVGGAYDLATDAAGDIFGVGGPGIFKLSPDGALQWTRTQTVTHSPFDTLGSAIAVSPDGTVVATMDAAFDGDGNDRFAITGLTQPRAVAVAPDGTVAVASEYAPSGGDQAEAHRYTKAGVELTTLQPVPGYYDVAMAYDALGYLCADTTGHGREIPSRTAPDLTNVFAPYQNTGAPANLASGVAVDSAGDMIAARVLGDSTYGLQVQVFSPTGTITWTHQKPSTDWLPTFFDGVIPTAIAADGSGHVAFAGTYDYAQPWIQVYTMP